MLGIEIVDLLLDRHGVLKRGRHRHCAREIRMTSVKSIWERSSWENSSTVKPPHWGDLGSPQLLLIWVRPCSWMTRASLVWKQQYWCRSVVQAKSSFSEQYSPT
jgi:hypothetical protein